MLPAREWVWKRSRDAVARVETMTLDVDPCAKCKGTRLKQEALAVKLGGKSIADLTSTSVSDTREFLQKLKLSKQGSVIGRKLLAGDWRPTSIPY